MAHTKKNCAQLTVFISVRCRKAFSAFLLKGLMESCVTFLLGPVLDCLCACEVPRGENRPAFSQTAEPFNDYLRLKWTIFPALSPVGSFPELRSIHSGSLCRQAASLCTPGRQISLAGSLWSPLMWKDRSDKLGRVGVICAPACAHAFARRRVPAPECVYLTRPAIRNPSPTPCFFLLRLALAVAARWDTARRLLFHTGLY